MFSCLLSGSAPARFPVEFGLCDGKPLEPSGYFPQKKLSCCNTPPGTFPHTWRANSVWSGPFLSLPLLLRGSAMMLIHMPSQTSLHTFLLPFVDVPHKPPSMGTLWNGWSLITWSDLPLWSHSSVASTSRLLTTESRSRDMKMSTWESRVGKNLQSIGNMWTALARRWWGSWSTGQRSRRLLEQARLQRSTINGSSGPMSWYSRTLQLLL